MHLTEAITEINFKSERKKETNKKTKMKRKKFGLNSTCSEDLSSSKQYT
jgi:hypothetical protein